MVNLAARLCDEAEDGQILVSQRVHAAVEHLMRVELVGELPLKGFGRPSARRTRWSDRHDWPGGRGGLVGGRRCGRY